MSKSPTTPNVLLCWVLALMVSSAFGYRFEYDDTTEIITDTETGLQWKYAPESYSTTIQEAQTWCDEQEGDWFLPMDSRLRELFDAGITSADWGYFCLESNCSSTCVWSARGGSGNSAYLFDFSDGNAYEVNSKITHNCRVFVTRYVPGDVSNFIIQEDSFQDLSTGLHWWIASSNPMSKADADEMVDLLEEDWRFPTTEELLGLYDSTIGLDDAETFARIRNHLFYSGTTEGLRDATMACIFDFTWGSYFVVSVHDAYGGVLVVRE